MKGVSVYGPETSGEDMESMKRLSLWITTLLAVCLLGSAVADHEVIPTVEESFAVTPREEFYTMVEGVRYAVSYQDPTLEIHISEGNYEGTNWTAARIKIAHPAQLRTAMYKDRYGVGGSSGEHVTSFAKRKNAVFAINDDWFMSEYRVNAGCVIRQGVTYRMRCDQSGNVYDILVIDDQGDFHVFPHATNADIENFEGNIVNAFVFGPVLVKDYEAQPVTENHGMGAFKAAQRMAIGQIGPLEYICVCSEGPEDPDAQGRTNTQGLTLENFGKLVASFGDVKVCYNLDGGSSSTMVFRGLDRRGKDQLYTKINAPKNPKVRYAGGCIYFTSAWVPDDAEGTANE